jgi:hypothetical protein
MPSLELNATSGAGSGTQSMGGTGAVDPDGRAGKAGATSEETGPGPGHSRDRGPLDSPQSRPDRGLDHWRERQPNCAHRHAHPLPVVSENG